MIYKLLDNNNPSKSLEVQHVDDEVQISIYEEDQSQTFESFVSINKDDLFKLIGVLHSIQKQFNR